MRIGLRWPTLRTFILLALLGLLAIATPAQADELVQVAAHRATSPPTTPAPPLYGYLARPAGQGPFPAVVVLHGCAGFGPHDIAAALRLRRLGYVALALDSLGNENHCGGPPGSEPEAIDAHAALRYLATQPFVQPHTIAVLGFSMGGLGTLLSVQHDLLDRGQSQQFRAAVAFYPPCRRSSGNFDAPTLILIGDHDDWASPAACRKMVARASETGLARSSGGAAVSLTVYPGATHAFDSPLPPRHYMGHALRYDRDATRDAWNRIKAFLAANLGPAAPTQSAPPQRGH